MRWRKKTAKEIKDTADVDHSYPTQPAPGGDIVDPIINTAQLADYINWQPNRILRLVRKGKVPGVLRSTDGHRKHAHFVWEEVKDWANERRVPVGDRDLSIKDVAVMLSRDTAEVKRWVKAGLIKKSPNSAVNNWLIRQTEVERKAGLLRKEEAPKLEGGGAVAPVLRPDLRPDELAPEFLDRSDDYFKSYYRISHDGGVGHNASFSMSLLDGGYPDEGGHLSHVAALRFSDLHLLRRDIDRALQSEERDYTAERRSSQVDKSASSW